MDEHLIERKVGSKEIFHGRIFDVNIDDVILPDGKVADREIVVHPGGVGILPLTDHRTVLMVRQFRCPHDDVLLEIPAGKLEKGEDPMVCGMRELEEETGMKAKEIRFLGKCFPTPAYCAETIYIYLATDLYPGEKKLDEGEFLDVHELPLEELMRMVMDGEILDAKTQIAILKTNEILKSTEE